ncbi:hypothetical protein Pmani_039303 [Petrolisthes manimaculis]|uniref:Uncharacterized protein n=1 Tax=Petrolisthes manimaculis TaxID=1843537 RepID=A0AAE1TLG7_9EUCA|nr:hypothetical protein Pmani_039303 [Petrolisthes manimaculis]
MEGAVEVGVVVVEEVEVGVVVVEEVVVVVVVVVVKEMEMMEMEAPEKFLVFHNPHVYPEGLMESYLGLQFEVSTQHFRKGAMTLRCTARISPLYLKTQQHSVDGELTYNFEPVGSPLSGGCGGNALGMGWMVMMVVMTVVVMAVTDNLLTNAPLR